jgi:hypothetical protein
MVHKLKSKPRHRAEKNKLFWWQRKRMIEMELYHLKNKINYFIQIINNKLKEKNGR